MKKLLIVCVLLAAGIVGYGFYAGWFSVSSDKTDSKANVKFSYDADKLNSDTAKAKEKLQPKETPNSNAKDPARQP